MYAARASTSSWVTSSKRPCSAAYAAHAPRRTTSPPLASSTSARGTPAVLPLVGGGGGTAAPSLPPAAAARACARRRQDDLGAPVGWLSPSSRRASFMEGGPMEGDWSRALRAVRASGRSWCVVGSARK
eukprot:3995313-Prymnesium_polylepis.1